MYTQPTANQNHIFQNTGVKNKVLYFSNQSTIKKVVILRAHTYISNYQDHFKFLSCALYLNYTILLNLHFFFL